MKPFLIPLLGSLAAGLSRADTPEYEYVIIGSGAGGGTLAANLARAGHSVFLIEAGADNGDTLLQRNPVMAMAVSEAQDSSWRFWVNHFRDDKQARRDWKFTYQLTNGSYHFGETPPPPDAEPLGMHVPWSGLQNCDCTVSSAGSTQADYLVSFRMREAR